MASSTAKLLPELVALHRLTQTEAMIAETRRSQAANSSVERELARNAQKCRDRAVALSKAITQLGGVPDVVGVAVGRASANFKAAAEQVQSFEGALLSDLALEHQLHDRALYLKALARSADEQRIVKLAERLETAHAETIEWIRTRLFEVATGGPTDLKPTPTQAAVSASLRLWAIPTRGVAAATNRAIAATRRLTNRVENEVEDSVSRVRQIADAAGEVYEAGRNAALRRTEQVARQDGDKKTAAATRRTRANLGVLDGNELPIRNYDNLAAADAEKAVVKLTDPADIRAVLAYEEQNKNRRGVTTKANARIEELGKNLVNA